ncbi:hypothetical protein SAMN05444004_103207 [Jannaschia faecimaris]|uniref:Uncharacterized protein n=1 Tax=Jannaschia faecimaris TaxID=1244108 RepID=A0A1H3MY25_9RHOB|nr:hypothetical protein [Jannaschia faecimaris]SDY81383.1 hypothetical protein SAMN05444004_103207 [Jannaschia faecimaris]
MLTNFIRDERAAISFDWIVLTAVLVATGMAVVRTVSGGIETVSSDNRPQLRGQIVQQSFGPDSLCSAGIDGLRAREAKRVSNGGSDPVDVDTWMLTNAEALNDGALLRERDRLAALTKGDDTVWVRDHTLQGLLECGMAQRGI